MNAFTPASRQRADVQGDRPRLLPSLAGPCLLLRDPPSPHQTDGSVTSESRLFDEKRAARSKLNSTMAVALTARQLASPRGAPHARAVAGPIDAASIAERP